MSGGRRRRAIREAKAYHPGTARVKQCRRCGRTYAEWTTGRCSCGGGIRWASGKETRGA